VNAVGRPIVTWTLGSGKTHACMHVLFIHARVVHGRSGTGTARPRPPARRRGSEAVRPPGHTAARV
jgi:hypothetical protein